MVCGLLAASIAGFLFTLGAFEGARHALFGATAAVPALHGGWTQWLAALLLGLGLAWTTVDINAVSLKITVAAVALAETAALAWILALFGILWPPFTALAAGGLALLFGLIYGRTAQGSRKRRLEELFAGRISRGTFRRLLESDAPLGFPGERREASVVVCEIFNRQLLRETLSPADYATLTGGFLQAGTRALLEAGGLLDQCRGESVRALFGAPLAEPDHAARACEAAFALGRRLEAFCQESVKRWNAAPDYRIGVNSGELIAAAGETAPGSGFPGGFSVTGEPLEFCRRLCVGNTLYGSRILLGPRAFALATGSVEVRPIELIRNRDHGAPEEIYELLAPKAQLTAGEQARRDAFWKAVVLFRERRWDEAARQFEAVLNEAGCEDGPARFYLDRIAQLRDGAPALDWDSARF